MQGCRVLGGTGACTSGEVVEDGDCASCCAMRVAARLGGLSVPATGWEAACKERGKMHAAVVEEREAAM